jgi:hypothetical protein
VAVLSIIASSCGRIGYDLIDGPPGVHGGTGGTTGSGGVPGGTADAASGVDSGAGGAGSGGAASGGASDGSVSSGGAAGSGGVIGNDAATGGGGALGSGGTADSGGTGGVTAVVTDGGNATLIVDVTDPTQTVLSGVAKIGTGELDLTFNSRDVVGAAYLPNPFTITPTTSFTVTFSFRIYGSVGQSGDGFAFLWQSDPRGTAAIGGLGQDLGYAGISPSVDVEFDVFGNVFDPGPNDVAITTNGQSTTALAHQFAPFMLDDGATHYAWIDYDAAAKTVSVSLANTSTRPAAALVSTAVDLYATAGSQAYVGFTAACGGSNDYFAIQSLTVQVSAQ